MPMMMHHDEQPLYTRGRPYGLLNQARLLRKAGAISLQVLMMTPATGSKLYAEAFTSGLPLQFLCALIRPKSRLYLADACWQLLGMWGLIQTIRRTFGWALHLMRGNIKRKTRVPTSQIPMRSPDGSAASHALPGTPMSVHVQSNVKAPLDSFR